MVKLITMHSQFRSKVCQQKPATGASIDIVSLAKKPLRDSTRCRVCNICPAMQCTTLIYAYLGWHPCGRSCTCTGARHTPTDRLLRCSRSKTKQRVSQRAGEQEPKAACVY